MTVKEVPQTYTVTLGGEQYELPLEDVQYTEEQADIPTEMTVEYKGEDKKPNAPQNKTFTLDDGTEVEGVLKEVNEVEDTDTWVDFTIDGQVVIPEGATAYVYLGKVHTYNPATPLWDGYKSDLMSAIGLNSDSYKITGGKWTSDPVARAEGGFYRTLSIYGQKNTGKSYAPDLSFCESYDRGVIELLSTVESELRVHCSLSVDDYMAEAILAGNNNMLVDENAVKIAKETADNYATALIRTISEKIKDDFKTSYFIFMGGGSAMMRESIERAIDTKNLFFLTDVTANAKGYEIMARAKLTMSGEI